MMGLADAAMYAAILGEPGRLELAVTRNLNINFLSRPGPTDLTAHARIMRLGRRSAVLEVHLYSDNYLTALPANSRPAMAGIFSWRKWRVSERSKPARLKVSAVWRVR